ncbi:MAG: hypothetical protein KDE19_16755, partial [Caldilineaceae bacterium]|nr:hypothetical protein [Caldilineaceae bacterium]
WPLVWGMTVGHETGNDVTAVRVTMLSFGVLLLTATAFIGRELQNNLAGWAAAIALLALPSFFYFGRAVMADLPAVALGMWAAWAAIRFFFTGKRVWLVGSALLLGVSLATKFLTIYALGWIGLLMFYRIRTSERNSGWQRQLLHTLRDGLLFVGCTFLTVLVIYLWYDLPALLRSVFGMRVAMREAFGSWASSNRDEVIEFWRFHAPLILLAGYGLLAACWGKQANRTFLLVSWLLLVVASLRVQNPLYHQHLQLLLPLLALFAGLGVSTLVQQLGSLYPKPRSVADAGQVALGLVLMSWLLIFAGESYRTPNRYTEPSVTGLRDHQLPMVEFLQKFTAPHDCVVTDDLNLAFISRRFPPPQLIDLSSARLATETISDERLITLTQRAGCQVVAPVTDRIIELSPGFDEWSQRSFLGTWQGEEDVLRLGQPLSYPQPAIALGTTLGDQLLLRGVDLMEERTRHALYVSLYWQSLTPLPVDYKIFVHLRDETNTTIVNGDHAPYDNLVPTTRWPVGSIVKETIRLELPFDLVPAAYQLFVGMYDPITQARLPVQGDISGENAVIIPLYAGVDPAITRTAWRK